ncbi:hypothetical protein [Legionella sp.]
MDNGLSAFYKRQENIQLLFVHAMAKRDIIIAKIYLTPVMDKKIIIT